MDRRTDAAITSKRAFILRWGANHEQRCRILQVFWRWLSTRSTPWLSTRHSCPSHGTHNKDEERGSKQYVHGDIIAMTRNRTPLWESGPPPPATPTRNFRTSPTACGVPLQKRKRTNETKLVTCNYLWIHREWRVSQHHKLRIPAGWRKVYWVYWGSIDIAQNVSGGTPGASGMVTNNFENHQII